MYRKLLLMVLLACAIGVGAAERQAKKAKATDGGQAAQAATAEAAAPQATGDQALTEEELDAKIAKLQELKAQGTLSEKGRQKLKDLLEEKDRRLLMHINGVTDLVYKKVEDAKEPLGEGLCQIYANMMLELSKTPRLEKVTQTKTLWYFQFAQILNQLRGPAKVLDMLALFEKNNPSDKLTDPKRIARHEELKAQGEQAAKVYMVGVETYKKLYKDRDKFKLEKKKKSRSSSRD